MLRASYGVYELAPRRDAEGATSAGVAGAASGVAAGSGLGGGEHATSADAERRR